MPTCAVALWAGLLDQRDFWWLTVTGRVEPEWTIARANEQMRVLSPGLLAATIQLDTEPTSSTSIARCGSASFRRAAG